jgi:hypothetical protein
MRERSDDLRRAELMVWLTGRIARDGVTSPERVRIAAREALSTFPGASVDENAVLAASRALQEAERRWAALAPGEELVLEWPDRRTRRPGSPRGARANRGRREHGRRAETGCRRRAGDRNDR